MKSPFQVSIRSGLVVTLIVGLGFAYVMNFRRMRLAESELRQLRNEVGYLETGLSSDAAAVRVASDEPLVWQARVRVPASPAYRVAYSAVWRASTQAPDWFAAQPIPPGESVVTIRVMKDPRDDKWRISTVVRHEKGTGRIGTVLAEDMRTVFRGSHDVISGGIGRQTAFVKGGEKLMLFNEKYFSGESLLLYGDRAPSEDVVGVFAELQPDTGPL